MKHTGNKCIETMIYQNLVANVLLDESKDELLSLDLNSSYTS